MGYHATVYYKDFQPPPSSAKFSKERGLSSFAIGSANRSSNTSGDWVRFSSDDVIESIYERAGNPDVNALNVYKNKAATEFHSHRLRFISILEVEQGDWESQFLMQLKDKVGELEIFSISDVERHLRRSGTTTIKDSKALEEGPKVPPHHTILSHVVVIEKTTDVVSSLAEMTKQAAEHFSRQRLQGRATSVSGTNVFIGHGHSQIWRELKDFIEGRLGLSVDEFDGVPTAGVTITDRLSKMLDDAAFAFLILTGEDEQPGGQRRARMNVIHEVGLFQGRLGFPRAIVLLEEGCERFSNIDGLIYIPFPKDHISSAFEEIRMVLEREGVLSTSA